MLWQFQVNSEGTHPYIYMNPFCPKPSSHPGWYITLNWVPCAIWYFCWLSISYIAMYMYMLFLKIYRGKVQICWTQKNLGSNPKLPPIRLTWGTSGKSPNFSECHTHKAGTIMSTLMGCVKVNWDAVCTAASEVFSTWQVLTKHFSSLLSKELLRTALDHNTTWVNIYWNKHRICCSEVIQKGLKS